MEFLTETDNEVVQKKVNLLMESFDSQLKNLEADAENSDMYQSIKDAPDQETKLKLLKELIKVNLPASAKILDILLDQEESDKFLHIHYMSLRRQVAMSFESFDLAMEIAEQEISQARALYEESKHTYLDGNLPTSPALKTYFQACIDCFLVCRYQGNMPKAMEYIEEAKRVANDGGQRDHQNLAEIFYADLLIAKGQLTVAINEILLPLLKTENLSDEIKGILLQKLGNACRSAAQWGSAKQHLRQSILLARKIDDKVAEYDRATDLGNVYRSEGRISDALDQQTRHLTFAFRRGDLWGLTVASFNMGLSYYSVTPNPDLERALILLVVKYMLAVRICSLCLQAIGLNNLGKAFSALGQYKMAVKVLKKSVELAIKSGNYPGEGMAYGNLGTAYRALGKCEKAVVYHEKYLRNAMGRGDDGGVAIMQRELALDYLLKGDLENAEKKIKEAILTLESIRTTLGTEDSSRLANFDKNQAEAYNLLQVILIRLGKIRDALALSEFGRGRAITDIVCERNIKPDNIDNCWLWQDDILVKSKMENSVVTEIIQDFNALADQLHTSFIVYSVVTEYSSGNLQNKWLYIWVVRATDQFYSKEEERISFRKMCLSENISQNKLISDENFFASLCRSFGRINLSKIAFDGLPANLVKKISTDPVSSSDCSDEDAIVEFPKGSSVLCFFAFLKSISLIDSKDTKTASVISEENTKRSVPINISRDHAATPGNDVGKTEKKMEKGLLRGTWGKEGQEQLCLLYKICIEPILEVLPKGTVDNPARIMVIPQEFLFHVPFSALNSGNNDYFIQRYIVSIAPSLRALKLLHMRFAHLKKLQGAKELKVLGVGNPTMSLSDFPEIWCSGKEVKLVQNIFGKEQCLMLVREDAKKSAVLENLGKIDILHLATHASPEDLEDEPSNIKGDYLMRGCVILSPSGDDCNGFLTAREIEKSNIFCQLVTLSCCETGLGKLSGDGVLGLYRAFFAAGAAGVLVTLWKIRDDVTPVFMERFYSSFKENEDIPGSLRAAMLHCIDKEKLPPLQWAAFSHIGASQVI